MVEGGTAVFTCMGAGEPAPTFLWYFQGESCTNCYIMNDVEANTSVLTVSRVSLSDTGEYTCFVINEHGNDSATAQLQVLSKLCYTFKGQCG